MTAFVANTNVLELLGLKSNIEGTFINDATVAVTIKDSAGEEVEGETWPLTMTYVGSSDGDYRAILDDELPFLNKKNYKAIITADGGADRKGQWEFTFTPVTRSSKDADD